MVACEGLYADIEDGSLKQSMVRGKIFKFITFATYLVVRFPNNDTRDGPRHQAYSGSLSAARKYDEWQIRR